MTSRQVETVSRWIRDARGEPPEAPSASARTRAIEAIEIALRARARRKANVRRVWIGFAAAAAIALVLGGVVSQRHHASSTGPTASASQPITPTPIASAQGLALADGTFLDIGSRFVAQPSRPAVLTLATGTVLVVAGAGAVTIAQADEVQKFVLSSGVLDARVTKLTSGHRFIIATPDAEVEVRGTAFEVSIVDADASCGDGTRTRVSVREGVVSVRERDHDIRVAAGEKWPTGCRETAALVRPSPTQVVTNTISSSAVVAETTPPETGEQREERRSTLAAQNDAFAHALLRRQHGDPAGCASELDTFIAQYPASPLVESARVEQLRALRVADSVRAAKLAKEYLAQYPAGFARAEAEAIANGK